MKQRTKSFELTQPVFAAVRRIDSEEEKAAWRAAKYTMTSPQNKEGVDVYIDRAYDGIGAYKDGELFPINASQIIASTRSEHPVLARFRLDSLEWANYTRPHRVDITFEEKENSDLNITVSIGKLCTELSCPQQERAVNPFSTLVFSPAEKARIDAGREARGEKTIFDGYKRYTGVISIPHDDKELINSCASLSLPGAEAGVEAGDTGYNVDTDAFCINIYYEQVSNEARAVKVGELVGFLTFRFETVFSDYLGDVNNTILAAHLKHVFKGIPVNAECRVSSYTDMSYNYERESENITVKGPCQLVTKGDSVRSVEGMLRVPLTGGCFACVPRPARIMPPDSQMLKAAFAKEWKKRKDPKYEQYRKIADKIKMHKTALRHIGREVARADEEDCLRSLREEEETHASKLEKLQCKMDMLTRTDLKQVIETVSVNIREITANIDGELIRPGTAGMLAGNPVEMLEMLRDGRIKESVGFGKAFMQDDTGRVELKVASTGMSEMGVASAFLSTNAEDPAPIEYVSMCSSLLIPAAFNKEFASTASVGNCILSAAVEPSDEAYIGTGQFVEYSKGVIEMPCDLDPKSDSTVQVHPTEKVPVLNIIPPIYSAIPDEGSNAFVKLMLACMQNNTAQVVDGSKQKSVLRNRFMGKKEPAKEVDIKQVYKRLQNPQAHRALRKGEKLPFRATCIPDRVATQANRAGIAKLQETTDMIEYCNGGSFVPESRYTIMNADKSSVQGLLKMDMKASGRTVTTFLIQAYNEETDEWWSPAVNQGASVSLDTELPGQAGRKSGKTTLRDVIDTITTTADAQLYVSGVPMYNKDFSKKLVRLTPTGDSSNSQSPFAQCFNIGQDTFVEIERDGYTEVRRGGVMVAVITYFSISPNFVITLPDALPGADKPVKISDRDNLFLYHHISHRLNLGGAADLGDLGGWKVGYTVLSHVPKGFPNYIIDSTGGVAGRVEVDETFLTIESFNTMISNFNTNN